MKKKKSTIRLRKWHKWVGLFLTFFLLMFSVSGVFLNHRRAISSIDISRNVLHKDYRYKNWNNGSVKATMKLSPDSILIYGNNGIWLTDSLHRSFSFFGEGLKKGADNRIVSNIVRTGQSAIFASTTFDLYRLDENNGIWNSLSQLIDTKERYTDLAVKDDSLVLMTRSHVYISPFPYTEFSRKELKAPEYYKKETTLFRIMWTLHSGELFGIPGKLFVDLLGILVIILCITGLLLTSFPKVIKRKKKKGEDASGKVSVFKKSLKWHNKTGFIFFIFLLILCISGMFLRPPLLIGIVRAKMKPLPGTTLNSNNPWFDKLRTIRYDNRNDEWLLYSSNGFFTMKTLSSVPVKLEKTPPVSVMGVTVFHQQDSARWIAGSFSGIYIWDKIAGESFNYFTGNPVEKRSGGMPTFENAVSGYSSDFPEKSIVFGYSSGAIVGNGEEDFASMPEQFKKGRMSLWHFCLEVHVGRIYAPLLGNLLSNMFVFIWGTLFLIVLITGYRVYVKRYRKRKE